MVPSTARRANAVLDQLLALPAAQRDRELPRLCAGDAAVERLVRRLLAHAETEAEDPTWHADQAWRRAVGTLFDGPEQVAASAGPYRLVRRLGIGGSAEVWLGEREVDGVVQQVAVKLLHADAASPAMLARFRQEQQILARLSHPAIGKIHDIGLTEQGRPYFVMEYVAGAPIDTWCDRRRLPLAERLHLFLRVADAVAYAHRALVIHRDIKPSNVLVDGDGHPRLLDFGIAKLLDGSGAAALTEPGGAPATLGYASPEQLRGDPVGVTADVYQLGMLLYVLLVGARPSLPRGLSRAEALQLASSELLRPSERLRRMRVDADEAARLIAEQRRIGVRRLLRELSGDLDPVVARAIAADPEARYPSVEQLADDVENVLEGRPVRARRGQWLHVLRKAVQRHPAAFALGFALLLSLVGATVAVSSIALDLDRARRSAILQGQLSDRVLEHVIGSLRELEPQISGFDGSIVRHALDRAGSAPPAQFGEDPLTQAQLRLVLARGYESLWAIEEAGREYDRAAAHLAQVQAQDDRRRLGAQLAHGRARIARVSGNGDAARTGFERALALAGDDPQLRPLRAQSLAGLAALAHDADRTDQAVDLFRQALADYRAVFGPAHPSTLGARLNIALVLLTEESHATASRLQAARDELGQLVVDATHALGAEATLTAMSRLLLGRTHCYARDWPACRDQLAAALPVAGRVLGERSLQVLKADSELGLAEVRLGAHAAGLERVEGALQVFNATWNSAGRHAARHDFGLNLAVARVLLGDADGAVQALASTTVDRALVERTPELRALLADPRLTAPDSPAR